MKILRRCWCRKMKLWFNVSITPGIPISVADLIDSSWCWSESTAFARGFDLRYLGSNINGTALFALSHLPYLIISLYRDVARFAQSSEDRVVTIADWKQWAVNIIFSERSLRGTIPYIDRYICSDISLRMYFSQKKYIPAWIYLFTDII